MLLLALLCFSMQGFAQNKDEPGGFRHITVRNGLPSSEVYKIHQDLRGYIWMCTDAGVCRYNGYGFESFTTRNGLTDNTVFRLSEDLDGKIWVQGFSGALSYFDGEKFIPIGANDSLVLLYANGQKNSFCMETDSLGGITVGGPYAGGLYRVGPEDNYRSLHQIKPENVSSYEDLSWITTTEKGVYYAAMRLNEPIAVFFHNGIKTEVNTNSKENSAGGQVYLTKDGRTLFSHVNTLYIISPYGMITIHNFPSPIVKIDQDASGNVWISTFFGGTFRFTDGDFTLSPLNYLSGKTVSGVHEDTQHGFWFSTVGDGVYYLPDIRFGYLTPAEGLSEPNVQAIAPFKKHQLIIGLPNGRLALLNPEVQGTGRLISTRTLEAGPLPYEAVLAAHDTIVGSSTGITFFDSTLKVLDSSRTGSHYKGFIRNPETNRLMYYSPATLVFMNSGFDIDSTQMTKIRFTTACLGNDGTIWLGALNGLWKLEGNQPVYMGDSANGIKARIDGICQDKNDVLWVATRGEGVFAIYGDKKWHYGEQEGMAANTCRAITLDPSGGIWVGTNHGVTFLSGFDRETGKVNLRSFNSSHGLLSDEVKFLLCFDDKLWMGSNEGLCWIGINALMKDSVPPPVYITHVLFGARECKLDTTEVFNFSDQTIRIFVEGLFFRDPEGVRYKYRMLGGDEEWITTANREISFAGLGPGEYRLEVVAVNPDGTESDHPAVFSFRILAPFYRTFWFIILMVLVLIGLVWLGASYFLRRKQKIAAEKAETERRIAELRLSALRAQMNPHFIFNAINSIQHFVLQNDSEQAYNYLAKFSRLIRLVLEQSQSESISLDQELKMLDLYIELEQLRFERPFTYNIEVDAELRELNIKIPGMLVQPFIENAIWHGLLPKKNGEAHISISFRKKTGFAEITVEDNGVGRKASAELKHKDGVRRSYGLQITEERLRLAEHKYSDQPEIEIVDLEDANGNATGTRVVINIMIDEYDD